MATFAGYGNTLVIKYAGGKAGGAVTYPAIFAGGDVCC